MVMWGVDRFKRYGIDETNTGLGGLLAFLDQSTGIDETNKFQLKCFI